MERSHNAFFVGTGSEAEIYGLYADLAADLEEMLSQWFKYGNLKEMLLLFNLKSLDHIRPWMLRRMEHPVSGNPKTASIVMLWQYPKPPTVCEKNIVAMGERDPKNSIHFLNASIDLFANEILYENLLRNAPRADDRLAPPLRRVLRPADHVL